MKSVFKKGDKKFFSKKIEEVDTAIFDSGQVHPVYATFALARDAEWTCRLFVLEMKEADEEGIGTMITVEHTSPALVGSTVQFIAEVESIERNEIICIYSALVGDRIIAKGKQSQKILKKEKIDYLFENIRKNG